ncbi:FecR domain-containing protein [Flavivirga amylovorans]|uniref:FecR domain-containing protein n=1 Tax=Flavivirga amylovorans TaxID=870486 RepID=A0ABT8X6W0_9FLAO|nr:FecR family protein [Flavivirga amylovorans]MDO5989741.1 FecR domain-containing protein [Flavivirga amylovorans]
MKDYQIIKYLKGETTSAESEALEDWVIASPQNAKKFNLLKAQHIASTFDETSKNINVDKEYINFVNKQGAKSGTMYHVLKPVFKYAALLLLFVIGYVSTNVFSGRNLESLQTIPEDAITLQLEDGSFKVILENGVENVFDSNGKLVGLQKGSKIIYDKEMAVDKLVYNSLIVPYGKRFDVELSDGTHILLNAGTTLRYPIKFLPGKNREVFLTGEAFFDVAKDANHPFIVNADNIDVKVLGTKFNVSSYPEDDAINTTLVEGSVTVNGSDNNLEPSFLKPGYNAKWNKTDNQVSIGKVNISLYTAWVEGKIVFRHMRFKNIRKKLERHYNVVIKNNRSTLDQEFFTASFDGETIEQVLQTFDKNYGIEYTFLNNEVIIN